MYIAWVHKGFENHVVNEISTLLVGFKLVNASGIGFTMVGRVVHQKTLHFEPKKLAKFIVSGITHVTEWI